MTLRKRSDSSTYQSVVRVPKDLIEVIGKKQLQRGLGTASKTDAMRLDKIHAGECELLFDKKRRELRGESVLTPAQIRAIARQTIETFRGAEFGDPLEEYSPTLRDLEDEYNSLSHYAPAAAALIDNANPGLNINDLEKIRRIILDEYQAELRREMGAAGAPSFFAPAPPDRETPAKDQPPEANSSTYNLGSKGAITLEKACELVKESDWWISLPAKTRKNYEPTFSLLLRLFGHDRYIHTLTPEDSTWLRKMLDALPMYMSRTGDARSIITGIIETRKIGISKIPEVVASGTKNKHRTVIRNLFRIMSDNWYLRSDITSNFKPWPNSDRKRVRIQFTDDELARIISRTSENPNDSELYWIPLCAVHTGARRGEICQLTPKDIILHENVWCFNISTENDDQSLKNPYSRRLIPIHSALIRLGFLDFVQANGHNENGRIWREVKRNRNGWGDNFGKSFARAIDGLFSVKTGYKKDFHSLRHTVKAILEPQLDYGMLDALFGWSSEERRVFERTGVRKKHTRDGYGSARAIDQLKDAVELIHYPWL